MKLPTYLLTSGRRLEHGGTKIGAKHHDPPCTSPGYQLMHGDALSLYTCPGSLSLFLRIALDNFSVFP